MSTQPSPMETKPYKEVYYKGFWVDECGKTTWITSDDYKLVKSEMKRMKELHPNDQMVVNKIVIQSTYEEIS